MLHPHRYKTGQFFASKDKENQAVLDPRSGVNSTCFLGELLELFTSVDLAGCGITYENDDEDLGVPPINELWEDDYLLTKLQTLVCAFVIKRLGYGRMLKHHVPTPDFDVIGALESSATRARYSSMGAPLPDVKMGTSIRSCPSFLSSSRSCGPRSSTGGRSSLFARSTRLPHHRS